MPFASRWLRTETAVPRQVFINGCFTRRAFMRLCRVITSCVLLLAPLGVAVAQVAPSAGPVDASTRQAVVASLGKQMQANYVFPDVAGKVAAALDAKVAGHAYEHDATSDTFAKALTHDLQSVGMDRHLRIMYDPTFKPDENDDTALTPKQIDEQRTMASQYAYGIAKVERLPGNVGYLDIRGFLPADFVATGYAAAMNLVAGSDALIIDLRKNGGGDPSSVATLLSYFFAEGDSRHLNDLYWRKGDRTQQFWTAAVSGPRYTRPVYVLTSALTFSGGEECAYDFQTQKRATLVGTSTGGGANPGDVFALGHGFVAFIPVGRAVNPVTHTNWEHVGVKPDIAVPAADAMKTAYVAILKKQIVTTKDPDQLDRLKATLARVEKGVEEKPNYDPPK
ncbi:S41 family peptidase [Rhodanobacter hydrolyticus]|uniref:S41 family peptidase n=1 Tax=Rhodanobacter hydrolyticus TaxID=2250595 RepID=A0ABW8J306_9GAMM